MQQKILDFRVEDQHVRAPHYRVVGDSRNYLIARFSFGENWRGLTKTAVFQGADGEAYHVLLENDRCLIPAEVIRPTRFTVAVFGGDRLTTDRIAVTVDGSGMVEGVTPPTPTPDIYNQLLSMVETERQVAEAAAVAAGEQADTATTASVTAQAAADRSETAAAAGAVHQQNACTYSEESLSHAVEAGEMANKATVAANRAQESAKLAAQSETQVAEMLGDTEAALDAILAIQAELIGGDTE